MALARGIAEVPAPNRAMACQAAFERAHVADKYRKRLGRLHPTWGNGSVMGFAMLAYKTRKQDDLSDPAYCDAFACALDALKAWRLSQSRRTYISKPLD